jgi:hypothetical protein
VRKLAELLHLPENAIPAEILVMGYPAQPAKQAHKKSLEELVFYNSFHQ